MSTLTALNSKHHKDVGINAKKVESEAGALNMVPVVLSEFSKVALQYPIVITKNQDTGRFSCIALFGLEKGENLFFNRDTWDAIYLPLQIRRQPFFIGTSEANDQHLICIDANHSSVEEASRSEDAVHSLFDESGNETDYLTGMKNLLAELFEGEKLTKIFIDDLLTYNLLQPLQLQITLVDQSPVRVEGLYTINEAILNQFTSDELFSLHEKKYLNPIYAMIMSVGHMYGLLDRKNKRILTNQWGSTTNI